MQSIISMEAGSLKTTSNKRFPLNSSISKELVQESCIQHKIWELLIYYNLNTAVYWGLLFKI